MLWQTDHPRCRPPNLPSCPGPWSPSERTTIAHTLLPCRARPCVLLPARPPAGAGEKLSESTASDVRTLCSTLLNAYLISLLDTGFLHADPHPGNLIRTPGGK